MSRRLFVLGCLVTSSLLVLGVAAPATATTAATVPLTIDYWRRQGKVKRGDRIAAAPDPASRSGGAPSCPRLFA